MTNQANISGRVTRLGYYWDTLPQLVISISKDCAGDLQLRDGDRKQFSLLIDDETYQAGIRTTTRSKYVTICPDLFDSAGNQIRLADLLLRNNIQQKMTVELYWDAEGGLILCK